MTSPVSHRGNGWPLVSLSLAMLLPSLGTSIANAGLPTLANAFGASFQDVQWIVLAYLLAMTTLVVSAGRLGDLFGRRRLLLGGVLIFAVAATAGALATDLWLLVAARAAQGIGAAIVMALTTALVGDLVPREKTGRAMGLLGTMSAVGTALGPSLGGILIAGFGWRAIFIVLAVLSVAALVMLHAMIPAESGKPNDRKGFDAIGTVLLAGALGAYALSMTIGRGAFGLANAALLITALAGLGLFGFAQMKVRSPLVELQWLADPRLRQGLIGTALVSTIMMTTLVVGPFYLSGALALTPAGVGLAMSVGPILAALAGVPAGRLVDRFGAGHMMLAGLAGIAAGCAALALLPATLGVGAYLWAIGIVTTGYAVFQAANNTAVMRDVGPNQRGTFAGMLSLARNLGLITGASAMGAVFSLASGGVDSAHAGIDAISYATALTFGVAAGLAVLALALTRTRGSAKRG